jgi:hypothetical protein
MVVDRASGAGVRAELARQSADCKTPTVGRANTASYKIGRQCRFLPNKGE